MGVERWIVTMFSQRSHPKVEKDVDVTPRHLVAREEKFSCFELQLLFVRGPILRIVSRMVRGWRGVGSQVVSVHVTWST
jgi:hypothetical protein